MQKELKDITKAIQKSMKKINEKFCENCGIQLKERLSKKYDSDTGEKFKEKYCPNVSCIRGCEDNGGHIYSKRPWYRAFYQPPSYFTSSEKICIGCGYYHSGSF